MPSFSIDLESPVPKTFRFAYIQSNFDLDVESVTEHFEGELPLPEGWKIGLIVGPSGTGKTTIAREVFGQSGRIEWSHDPGLSVVDEMPKGIPMGKITKTFASVGFSSVPSWLKPFHVLSNGEKMRVELAYSLLNDENLIVFDEFTSVVDRQVAKTACIALNKAIHRSEKQFVAVSCHYDVEEYLEPDWVLDTSDMSFRSGDEIKVRDTKNSRSAPVNGQSGGDLGVITI